MKTGYQIVLAVVAALALYAAPAESVIPCGTDAQCVALNGGEW